MHEDLDGTVQACASVSNWQKMDDHWGFCIEWDHSLDAVNRKDHGDDKDSQLRLGKVEVRYKSVRPVAKHHT